MRKKYEIKIYYTSFCTYKVKANDESSAITIARNLEIDKEELLTNLENWEDADEANEIKHSTNK